MPLGMSEMGGVAGSCCKDRIEERERDRSVDWSVKRLYRLFANPDTEERWEDSEGP